MSPVTTIAIQILLVIASMYFLSRNNTVNGQTPCSKYNKCSCFKHKRHLSSMTCGRNTPPHTIPRPPAYINIVILSNMQLGYITKDMTRNLTFCHLTKLVLKDNNITGITEDAFEAFLYLYYLSWTQNVLPVRDFKNLFLKQGSNLTALELEGAVNYSLEPAMFLGLGKLKVLALRSMDLVTFNASLLSGIDQLSSLDLSNNHLVSIMAAGLLPKLKKLNLNGNSLTRVPAFCKENTTYLSIIDLGNNNFRELDDFELSCINNLEKLVISENRIEVLRDNMFANLPQLYSLDISNMVFLKRIDKFAFNSSSLRSLYFKGNPKMYGNYNPRTLFKYVPNLQILDLSKTLTFDFNIITVLFENLRNIQKLVLKGVNMKIMPSGLFQKMRHLHHLDLSKNIFPPWKKTVFENVSSIRILYIVRSNIRVITEDSFPLEFRLNLQTINLSNNPFQCNCELLWFKTWMDEVIRNKSIHFQRLSTYKCYKHIPVKSLRHFHPTAALCRVREPYVISLTIALSVALVLIVAGLVTYRYRWYILYWISLLRRSKQHVHLNVDWRNDGFVSYSNPDLDWVLEELLVFLEEEVGLKLCEHGRDFQPGKYIVDNVIEAVDNSRKTILVISNEYMKSAWCQFELNMVLSSYLNNDVDIVVILLENIEARHMTSSLRALMVSTTYLKWSEEEEARRLFRERLKNAMTDRS